MLSKCMSGILTTVTAFDLMLCSGPDLALRFEQCSPLLPVLIFNFHVLQSILEIIKNRIMNVFDLIYV